MLQLRMFAGASETKLWPRGPGRGSEITWSLCTLGTSWESLSWLHGDHSDASSWVQHMCCRRPFQAGSP